MQSFLYKVATDLKQRFGDEISKTAIVFNNTRPFIYLKKHLSEVYGKSIICPSLYTIQEFMALGTSKNIAQDLNRFFLLYSCYNQLLQEEGKEPVNPSVFYPMSQTILSDFDQIDYELVNPEALYTHLKDLDELKQQFSDFTEEQQQFIEQFWSSFSPEKQVAVQQKFIELWKRLPRLYTRLQEKLASEDLESIAYVYRQLAEEKLKPFGITDQFQQVAFVGFNALNKCEGRLFQMWQEAGKAIFYFDADSFYFDNPMQEAGMFLRKSIHEYGLKNALGAFNSDLNNHDNTIITYPISGNTIQAKALAVQLEETANKSPKESSKTAIILADETLLTPVLQSVSDESTVNITMGYPLRQSTVFQLIQVWISLQQLLQTKEHPVFSEQEINMLLSQNILELSQDGREDILKAYGTLNPKEFLKYLQHFHEVTSLIFTKNETGIQSIESLRNLIRLLLQQKETAGNLNQLDASLMIRVVQELTKLKDQLTAYTPDLTIDLCLKLAQRSLSGLSAPIIGAPLEGIQVMGMLESRCLDFDEVYILSANDGILPYNGVSNTFIPDSLRRAFHLPVKEYQEALSAYLFYRLCHKARNIHVFYNSLVDNNSTGEITRFVSQLAFESRITVQENRPSEYPQGQSLALPALSIEKTAEIALKLNQYLSPGKLSFSASALKKYLECPLQFFMKYIAGIKEPEDCPEAFDPAVMGTAFHEIMQQFYKEYEGTGQLVTKQTIENKLSELPELCHNSLLKSISNRRELVESNDSRIVIAEKILLENARLILKHDAGNVAPFKILHLEYDCSLSLPLDIRRTGKPELVNFRAIIDRVDEVNGAVRIVDYKTGGDSIIIKAGLETLFSQNAKLSNPAAFQALLYCLLFYKKQSLFATPHLYVIRNIQQDGSLLQTKASRAQAIPLKIQEALPQFETHLCNLIATLFDPTVPFRHNVDALYCASSPYAMFCNGGAENEEDENEEYE